MTRRGVTLVEILVASGVLAALLMPLLSLFSSTTRRVGTELRFVEASGLADELLSQVAHIHRRLGRLASVPTKDHEGGRARNGELDLETYLRVFEGQGGPILLPSVREDARGSQLHLSPSRRGFRRFLKISALSIADAPKNITPDILWLARVRVEYDLVLDGRDVKREVVLQSYYFQKCAPDGKFKKPE